jgi:signal peptidase I
MSAGKRRLSRILSPRRVVAFCVVVSVSGFALFVVEQLLYLPVRVPSRSMQPELKVGDRVLVDRRTPFSKLKRGDVVVFRTQVTEGDTVVWKGEELSDDDVLLVKRVIALPGESIQAKDGVVAINDTHQIDEPYVHHGIRATTFERHTVRDGTMWVMGDDRAHSRDSRDFGLVPKAAYIGTVQFRYWPVTREGTIS